LMAKSENHRACPVDEARLLPPLKFLHFPFKFLAGFLFVTTYRCIMVMDSMFGMWSSDGQRFERCCKYKEYRTEDTEGHSGIYACGDWRLQNF